MELSIVTTMYFSSPYIHEFYDRMRKEAEKITQDFEIIFVNDGSPDDSLDIALSIQKKDNKVIIIDLSRNFGHHKAIMTGLSYASGKLVFLLDSDLEEEPELLGKFYTEFEKSNTSVVYGILKKRRGRLFQRFPGALFYWLFNRLSNHTVPANQITARLMSQKYVFHLVKHKEHEIFLPGLWAITGFKQVPLAVNKHLKGISTYNLKQKVSLFVNAITSFSSQPLVFIFYLGCIILLLSGTAALYLIIKRIFFGVYLVGWPSLIVSLWLLGGLTIFCLGIIGIYLSKVFTETKQRPYTVIRKVYKRTEEV